VALGQSWFLPDEHLQSVILAIYTEDGKVMMA
jgi:hypothetical protein